MTTIPQRELRNNVSDVLRRAEAGEQFTITVNGRPVAELGPAHVGQLATAGALTSILETAPVDPAWASELGRMRRDDLAGSIDPWSG